MKTNFEEYLADFRSALSTIDLGTLESVSKLLVSKRNDSKSIYIAGNGGSAANADHLATDLMFGTDLEINSFKTHSLNSNNSSITATANDVNFDSIFSRQLLHHGKEGDLLVVISASGNSSNLINATLEARNKGMETLGILGFDGGRLLALVDYAIHVKTKIGSYGISEDLHSMINHMLIDDIKKKLTT